MRAIRIMAVALAMAVSATAFCAPMRSNIGARYTIMEATGEKQIPLPEGVVAVEYIESSGTQWIDSSISGNLQGLTIDLKIYPVAWRQWGGMVGNFVDNGINAVRLGFSSSDNSKVNIGANCRSGVGLVNGNGSVYVPNLIEYWHYVHFDIDARKASIDDIIASTSGNGTDNSTTIRLFHGGSGTRGSSVRISSFIAYQNGTKILHLIPVREENVGCMFDLVAREMFYNKGTGSFINGPDKP